MSPLEIVQLANSGLLLWTAVGPLLEKALASDKDVSLEDLDQASITLGQNLDRFAIAIELKRIRDAKR